MQNIKVGTPVYNYMQMGRVGIVRQIKTNTANQVWMTEGSPSGRQFAVVEYPDGKVENHPLADLMRADLD
jgi:hypothetical protein